MKGSVALKLQDFVTGPLVQERDVVLEAVGLENVCLVGEGESAKVGIGDGRKGREVVEGDSKGRRLPSVEVVRWETDYHALDEKKGQCGKYEHLR